MAKHAHILPALIFMVGFAFGCTGKEGFNADGGDGSKKVPPKNEDVTTDPSSGLEGGEQFSEADPADKPQMVSGAAYLACNPVQSASATSMEVAYGCAVFDGNNGRISLTSKNPKWEVLDAQGNPAPRVRLDPQVNPYFDKVYILPRADIAAKRTVRVSYDDQTLERLLVEPAYATASAGPVRQFTFTQTFHIGDNAFNGSQCWLSLAINQVKGKNIVLGFTLMENDSDIVITIGKLCGMGAMDRYENYLSIVKNNAVIKQFRIDPTAGSWAYRISPLPAGTYSVLINGKADQWGDFDDFLAGDISVQSVNNKTIVQGAPSAY